MTRKEVHHHIVHNNLRNKKRQMWWCEIYSKKMFMSQLNHDSYSQSGIWHLPYHWNSNCIIASMKFVYLKILSVYITCINFHHNVFLIAVSEIHNSIKIPITRLYINHYKQHFQLIFLIILKLYHRFVTTIFPDYY